jgi:hypothetical protein
MTERAVGPSDFPRVPQNDEGNAPGIRDAESFTLLSAASCSQCR